MKRALCEYLEYSESKLRRGKKSTLAHLDADDEVDVYRLPFPPNRVYGDEVPSGYELGRFYLCEVPPDEVPYFLPAENLETAHPDRFLFIHLLIKRVELNIYSR